MCLSFLNEILRPHDGPTTLHLLSYHLHSVIYNPKAADNEEQSAQLFLTFAEECLPPVNMLYTLDGSYNFLLASLANAEG